MATFAFIDAKVVVNSVNLSDHVRKVKLSIDVDDLDNTAMGATYKNRQGGLKDWSVDIEFNQDFAASNVDATLFPLIGTVVSFTLNPTSGANSATNPAYSGNLLIKEYTPLDGSVGDLGVVSFTWPGAGALSRLTS